MSRLPLRLAGLVVLTLTVALASPAHALRVLSWNVLNYPGSTGDAREDDYRLVLETVQPDVILLQEIRDTSGYNEFFTDVLEVLEPGAWTKAPFQNGFDTDNACYFRTAAVDYVGQVVLDTSLRDINGYFLRPAGYSSASAEMRFYSVHLKAGGEDFEAQRAAEAAVLRNHLNTLPAGTHFAAVGDFNLDSASEPAYGTLAGLGTNAAGRLFDPIDEDVPGNWGNNSGYAHIHTQSPRTADLGDGGSRGGLDDRFDLILVNDDFEDGEGIAYVPGSYTTVGQDGLHFNQSILAPPANQAVSAEVAAALHAASDHLPIYIDVQLPARVSVVAAPLDFGTMIEGAVVNRALLLENGAALPADDLDYDLTADPGFTAPTGPFAVEAAAGFNVHVIGVDTSVPAVHDGDVVVDSDDPDTPLLPLAATATVLGHAVPSTRSDVVALAGAVDFGSHAAGGFSDQTLEVHNLGFGSLQALLDVHDFSLSGPDAGRFSLVAFAPKTAGSTPATFDVSFDDVGAGENTTYTATLTLQTRDQQDLQGALDRPDLTYELEAFVETATDAPPAAMARAVLYPNRPNPFNPATTLRFDLASAAEAELSVYDARGRHVRTLVDARLGAGRHEYRFDGRDAEGRLLASGVYLYRLTHDGVAQTRRMILAR